MKKAIVISLVSLFMVNSLDLHEWMKLPSLVHHFFEHQSENSNETFFDFISHHYAEDYTHHHSNKHHDDLPFKSNDCSSFHSPLAFFHAEIETNCIPVVQLLHLNYDYQEAFLIQSFSGKIWQPPKL